MKKLTILVLTLIFPIYLFGQEYYYYKNKKVNIQKLYEKKFILFKGIDNKKELIERFKTSNIEVIKFKSLDNKIKNNTKKWAVIQKNKSEATDLLNANEIIYEAPFYSCNNDEMGLSHLFYVKLKNIKDSLLLKRIAERKHVKIIGNNRFMPLWYTLSCNINSMGNALQMANYFHETGYFSASEPDFMVDSFYTSIQANFPNDLYFNDQWGLSNTGQYCNTNGIDINFCNASQLTFGNSNVIIAVIDHGLEMNHPDMTNIYSVSYDTENDMAQSNIYGPHGTACAGIIGANPNNEAGISGIAPSCQIMSISNELVLQTGTKQKLANGINFAWQNGAHVISNSWGHDNLQSSLIDDAINNAFENGRNGKGSIVVFSAGNNNSSLIYPANSHPNILAVGAISPSGKRKSPSTCDTENWGSNYGDELDIVAPGVLVPTIDRQGNAGYNPNISIHTRIGGTLVNDDFDDNDYTIWFNGTSAACPHVSSVAGLILSFNHSFTQKEIADIIESSSQKVGGYNYQNISGRPNGTWNNEMGYGLLDACRAVMEAIERGAYISGPETVCSGSATFTIHDNPPGVSVNWSHSSNFNYVSGQGTDSYQLEVTGHSVAGPDWVKASISVGDISVSIQKDVYLNPPSSDLSIEVPYEPLGGDADFVAWGAGVACGITNYNWSVEGGFIKEDNNDEIIITPTCCKNHLKSPELNPYPPDPFIKVTASASNNCGSYYATRYISIDCDYGGVNPYNVYPNPADDQFTVTMKDDENSTAGSEGNEIQGEQPIQYAYYLYDMHYQLVREIKTKQKKVQIKTNNLEEGFYFLKIVRGKKVWNKKIEVRH